MSKIGEIFVEVSGDYTQFQKDMKSLRSDAKASGTEISNALNNSISPHQAIKQITDLSNKLTQLASAAKVPADQFRTTSDAIAQNLGDLAKKAGLTEAQFSKLNERMLRNQAYNNAERSLLGVAKSAGLSADEAKNLAIQMGFSEKEAEKMSGSLRRAGDETDKLAKLKHGLKVAATAAAAAMTVVGGALVVSVREAVEAEKQEAKLNAVLESTGHAAGFNVEELTKMASSLQNVTTFSDDTIMAGMGILATFKKVRGEGFERATQAALDMSTVMEQDLKTSITQIGKALNDPIKGLTALSKAGVQFTEEQKNTITELVESNRLMEAQGMILTELESQFGGAAEAVGDTFGGKLIQVQHAFNDLQEAVGKAITGSKDFGGALDTVKDKLVELTAWVENHEGDLQIYFEGAVEMVQTIIDRIGVLARSAQIIALVKEGELSLWEAAKMGPKEAKEYLDQWNHSYEENYGHIQKSIEAKKKEVPVEDILKKAWRDQGLELDELNAQMVAGLKNTTETTKETKKNTEETGHRTRATREISGAVKTLADEEENLRKQMYDTGKVFEVMLPEWMEGTDALTKNIADTTDLMDADWKGQTDYVKELQEGLVNDLGNIFSGFINDVLTGEIDSIEDLFKGLFDSILDMFSRLLAQLATNSLIDALFGAGASGGLTFGGLFGGGGGGAGIIGSLLSGGSIATSLGGGGGTLGSILGALGLGSGGAGAAGGAGSVGAGLGIYTGAPLTGVGGAGGAAGGGGGIGSLGFAPWMGPAAIGAIGLGLWVSKMFEEDVPPLSELMNQQGIGPEYFAAVVGDSFKTMRDPIYNNIQGMMMDANSLILTMDRFIGTDIPRLERGLASTTMMYFNTTTKKWDDLSEVVIGFGVLADNMGEEAAAAMLEAKTGVVGLAEELLDTAKAQETSLDLAVESMQELGIEGEDLEDVLGIVGEMMSGVTKGTDKLSDKLHDLGLAADQADNIISELGFTTVDLADDFSNVEAYIKSFTRSMQDLDFDEFHLVESLEDINQGMMRFKGSIDELDTSADRTAGSIDDLSELLDAVAGRGGGGATAKAPVVNVYLQGNDIIDSKKLNARVAVIADQVRVAAARRPNMATRRVYA